MSTDQSVALELLDQVQLYDEDSDHRQTMLGYGLLYLIAHKHPVSDPSRRIRRLVYERDEARCCECGSTKRLEIDHQIPRALAGGNHFVDEPQGNLQILCKPCHINKTAGDTMMITRARAIADAVIALREQVAL